MTDAELDDAITGLESRIISGVKSTTTDGVETQFESIAEARAELRRLKRVRCRRQGCAPKTHPYLKSFWG